MTNLLCCPKRQSLSPQQQMTLSKRFPVVLLALGPSLTTWKHLATKVFCLHRVYATKNCKKNKDCQLQRYFYPLCRIQGYAKRSWQIYGTELGTGSAPAEELVELAQCIGYRLGGLCHLLRNKKQGRISTAVC